LFGCINLTAYFFCLYSNVFSCLRQFGYGFLRLFVRIDDFLLDFIHDFLFTFALVVYFRFFFGVSFLLIFFVFIFAVFFEIGLLMHRQVCHFIWVHLSWSWSFQWFIHCWQRRCDLYFLCLFLYIFLLNDEIFLDFVQWNTLVFRQGWSRRGSTRFCCSRNSFLMVTLVWWFDMFLLHWFRFIFISCLFCILWFFFDIFNSFFFQDSFFVFLMSFLGWMFLINFITFNYFNHCSCFSFHLAHISLLLLFTFHTVAFAFLRFLRISLVLLNFFFLYLLASSFFFIGFAAILGGLVIVFFGIFCVVVFLVLNEFLFRNCFFSGYLLFKSFFSSRSIFLLDSINMLSIFFVDSVDDVLITLDLLTVTL
ncbi:AAEL009854-PA, partial [Aedes aegypti]